MVADGKDSALPVKRDTCEASVGGTRSLPTGFGANRIRGVQQHPHQGPPKLLLSQKAKPFLGTMTPKRTLETTTNFDFEVEVRRLTHDPPSQNARTHHHPSRENQHASSSSSLRETCWTSQTHIGFEYIYLRYHPSSAKPNLSDTAGVTFAATTNPLRSTT
jgi:hypothetical protein